MSLPPVQARPLPPPDTRGGQARPGQEDALAGSGKPFDILLAEHGGPQMPRSAQDGDARRGQDGAAPTVAEMFNERGFFANAADLHPQASGDPVSQRTGHAGVEAISAQPAPAPVHIAPQAPSASGPNAVPPSGASRGEPSGAGTPPHFAGLLKGSSSARLAGWTTASPAAPGVRTRNAPRILAVAARAPAADAKRPAASQDNLAASRADKRLAATIEEHLRRTSASNVRVEVRAAEDGLLVTAQTDKLDRAERSRLLTEITALLSRHGRVPPRISLNGEFAPIRQV